LSAGAVYFASGAGVVCAAAARAQPRTRATASTGAAARGGPGRERHPAFGSYPSHARLIYWHPTQYGALVAQATPPQTLDPQRSEAVHIPPSHSSTVVVSKEQARLFSVAQGRPACVSGKLFTPQPTALDGAGAPSTGWKK
jgi:hypothetical protein